MKITSLGHIAVAVESLQEALKLYRDTLGFDLEGIEDVPAEKMRAAMLVKNGVTMEVMEPTDPDGPIGRFVKKRGGGLHHVTFTVEDIEEAVATCRRKGLRLIEPAPRPGVHGALIAFLHPQSTGGVLIELQQPPHPSLSPEGKGRE